MNNKAILIGVSDGVGQALARELSAMYQTVILITRTPPKAMTANMQIYQVADFDALATMLASISIGADTDAFSCLELNADKYVSADEFYRVNVLHNLQFANLCHEKGVERFFYLSRHGVERPDKSDDLSAKADVEYHLRTLGFGRVVIFRPYKTADADGLLSQVQNRAFGVANRLLSSVKLSLDLPLNPKQVAACMAMTAYRLHSNVADDAVTIVTHAQMSRFANQKALN